MIYVALVAQIDRQAVTSVLNAGSIAMARVPPAKNVLERIFPAADLVILGNFAIAFRQEGNLRNLVDLVKTRVFLLQPLIRQRGAAHMSKETATYYGENPDLAFPKDMHL